MASTPPLLYQIWEDHTHSGLGAYTVTLPTRHGDFLIAALALIVTLTGEGLWKIIANVLHRVRAKDRDMDVQHLENQVILRNQTIPFDSALEFGKVAWAWRNSRFGSVGKTLSLMIWPLCIMVAFSVASIYSAKVSRPAYEANRILLTSSECGLVMPSLLSQQSVMGRLETQEKYIQDMRQSRAYAEACYHGESGPAACDAFAALRLPFEVDEQAECPFGQRCLLGSSGAVRYDTGRLDSHTYLGINANPADRIDFRITSTCSVLDIEDLRTVFTEELTQQQLWNVSRAYLGPVMGISDWTYQHSDMLRMLEQPYSIQSFHQTDRTPDASDSRESSSGTWRPIEELQVGGADLSVHFVAANNVTYTDVVIDPLFAAARQLPYGGYRADNMFRVLACADQMQVCTQNGDACSPMQGLSILERDLAASEGFSPIQEATAVRIAVAFQQSSSYFVVASTPQSALKASDLLISMAQDSRALPADQWIRETTGWFETGLANLQLQIAQYPNNFWSTNGSDTSGITPPSEYPRSELGDALSELCSRQMGRNTGSYQSFSIAGLLIIGIVAFLVLLTSLAVPSIPSFGSHLHKKVAYIADGKLQLLRQVLQARGLDGWERKSLNDEVPVLANGYDHATTGPAEESQDFMGYHNASGAEVHRTKHDIDGQRF